ncbi:dnaA protein helix-turn-helix [Pedobacter terrae]|uniref:DnaA protein helix-turn-helix n=1 Tax=Pedobacter terrae TaxID=405671 RepID=A0A1G7T8U7_9SPHI|nr:hypothetical protein [Pedobacter terrae]SDG31767.1 dnaA protein helix-turn-helix [Pedobacter terrae]
MKGTDVIAIVEKQTGFTVAQMKATRKDEVIKPRYLLTLLLHEEGWSAGRIAELFTRNRTGTGQALKNADRLLGNDKSFKENYLACVAKITEIEDAI